MEGNNMGKSKKTKEAIKRAKRKKIIMIAACITVAAVIVAAVIFFVLDYQNNHRVYASGDSTVTLSSNGNFRTKLYHGERITGTYTESDENGVTVITFTHDGKTSTGMLLGNNLTIPDEWDDDHGHGSNFTLR